MGFGHGSKAKVYANGYDLTPYLTSFGASGSADTSEVTVLGNGSKAYLAGLKDATFSGEGFYAAGVNEVDPVLRAALGTDNVVWAYMPQGDTFSAPGYGFTSVETSYEVSSPVDGVTDISVEAQSSSGLEPVQVLHEWKAESAAGQGGNIVASAATSSGAVGYLVLAAGTSVVVKIEHSTDGTTFSTLLTFTTATGPTAERKEVTGTVNRYVRVTWDKACTFWAGFYRR